MPAESLILASEAIGFISFGITLLTLLGVYRDLISTLRSAPTQIPLVLSNLRQELLCERAFLRQRALEGKDPFGVFPGKLSGLPGQGRVERRRRERKGGREGGKQHAYTRLLEVSINDLWLKFKMLERPFLVQGGLRAEAVRKGDYWGEEDVEDVGSGESEVVDEKGGAVRRRKGRKKRRGTVRSDREEWEAAEEDLHRETDKYYNTSLTHRFIWWQTRGDIVRLADAVQRLIIRRMERDIFETDELVRMLVRNSGIADVGARGRRPGGGSGSGSESEADSDVVSGGRSAQRRSRPRPVSRSRSRGGAFREVEEHEVVRRPARPTPSTVSPTETQARRRAQSDNEANTAARRRRSDSVADGRSQAGPRVEYEVLQRGRDGQYVVIDTLSNDPTEAHGRPSDRRSRRDSRDRR
jgi:hypothetical protein